MSKRDNATKVDTLERGNIYFFYRPRVDEKAPQGEEDIQRLYVVMSPSERKRYRLAVIGQKEMPQPSQKGRRRYWGFVETVRKSARSIRDELGSKQYRTRTRGERQLPAARPAGEGVYRIVRHGDHTHLAYELELPKSPGGVQEELNIEPEASYIISIKNPDVSSPKSAGLREEKQAHFPRKLMKAFHDRKFIEDDPPEFLDYEGAEFVLIPASEDVKEELGIDLEAEDESREEADIFKDLGLDRVERTVKPLITGEWA